MANETTDGSTVCTIPDNITINGSINVSNLNSIGLSVAISLFTYADFSSISNIKTFALSCIEKGKIFEDAYNVYTNKVGGTSEE